MTTEDLVWTAEEACQNAWPSPRQILIDGWLLRASGGSTRRTNSVNPLRGGPRDSGRMIAAAEEIYRSLGLPTIFRVPSFAEEMDGPLERHGYSLESECCTLFAAFTDLAEVAHDGVALAVQPTEEWFSTWENLSSASDVQTNVYRRMTEAIALPKIFASLQVDGMLAAIAYGAIHKGLLVVESVATRPAYRQRGYAAATVGGLMAWARSRGAYGGCLQVVADNLPARALYKSLGFRTELYRYHYRTKRD